MFIIVLYYSCTHYRYHFSLPVFVLSCYITVKGHLHCTFWAWRFFFSRCSVLNLRESRIFACSYSHFPFSSKHYISKVYVWVEYFYSVFLSTRARSTQYSDRYRCTCSDFYTELLTKRISVQLNEWRSYLQKLVWLLINFTMFEAITKSTYYYNIFTDPTPRERKMK